MSLYTIFKTDDSLETNGITIDYGPNSKGKPTKIRIARSGGANKSFSKTLERLTRPHRRAIQNGLLDNATADAIFRQAFVESVLLGWENVEGPTGDDLPYTQENALTLLTDLPDLYTDLREQANNAALFRAATMEADLGNSGR